MKTIHIDATCIGNRPSGARQRFIGIYRELVRIRENDQFFVHVAQSSDLPDQFASSDNLNWVSTPLPAEGRWNRLLRGSLYWATNPPRSADIFEYLHLPVFGRRGTKQIVTIHDLRTSELAQSPFRRALVEWVTAQSLTRSDIVIAVSGVTKRGVVDVYSGADVRVVYNGVDLSTFDAEASAVAETEFAGLRLPQDYVLAVGHLESRKRYDVLLRAIHALKLSGVAVSAVIVGNDSGERALLDRLAAELQITDLLHIRSNLNDRSLRAVYRRASALVFPSQYEGFGIPILEAMASGIPTVLSNIEVFRELTQDRGCYFDVNSHESLAIQLRRVLFDDAVRQEQLAYGRSRVQDFDFKSLACEHSRIYDEILS